MVFQNLFIDQPVLREAHYRQCIYIFMRLLGGAFVSHYSIKQNKFIQMKPISYALPL